MTDIPAEAIYETWDTITAKTQQLAKLISDHSAKTGEQFDAIVVIPRGSYFPVNLIARQFGFLPSDLLHACINSYEAGSSQRKAEFELGQMPAPADVKDKHLLIVDEVCDTGYTLDFLTKWLAEQGAALTRSAVIHYKPSKRQADYKPDMFVEATDEWIVYPWEADERQDSHVKRGD